jgi:pimeloyl-ACP methyl ester carboxylesterase
MALFVLVPGAGGQATYWALLVPELERRGHQATAVDIAEDDPALGLPDYARIVDQAIGDQREVVLVAQSMGGFTAPMVGKPVAMIVLLNAMSPTPARPRASGSRTPGPERRAAPPTRRQAVAASLTPAPTSCTTCRPRPWPS